MATLYVIGIGPGGIHEMSNRSLETIEKCGVVVGYKTYIGFVKSLLDGKEVIQTGMKKEIDRVKMAIKKTEENNDVAIISSGDAGVYGMAGLTLQMARDKDIDIEIIPGITASSAAASILGAPLMHDYCHISLSDLLTPYDLIEKRVKLAAEGDFVIAIYNPRSNGRKEHLKNMIAQIRRYRSGDTPIGMVKNALREGQESYLTTLDEFDCKRVDMMSIVIVGNSNSFIHNGKMITPRGYERKMK